MRTWIQVLLLPILLLAALPAKAQYLEEIATLESIYESRARAVLNTVLRPGEYTVVVSADIERDDDKLKDYREQMELSNLPGLPMLPDPTMSPATNELHSMKSRVNVTLVIKEDVPAEKEAVIKAMLSSKLHLDETTGDQLNIQRTKFPEDAPKPPKEQEVLPEFTWRTWALIVLVALILTAGLIFWATRKGNDVKEEKSLEQRRGLDKDEDEENDKTGDAAVAAAGVDAAAALAAKEDSNIRIEDLRERLLMIVTQYPQVSSKAAAALIESDDKVAVLTVFEDLGWDVVKRLFSSIPPRTWGRLGSGVKGQAMKPDADTLRLAYETLYKGVVARFLETGAREDSNNPFAFVESLAPSERDSLLAGEKLTSFAVLSLYLSPDSMADVLSRTASEMQSGLPAEVARLESLPDSIVKTLVAGLQEKLVRLRANPVHRAEGPAVAARILRSFPALREEELFHELLEKNPHEAAKIRRSIVLFTDLPYYPQDLLASCLNLTEVEDLTKAMKGVPAEVQQSLLNLLPPRRAQMIQRDLGNAGLAIIPRDSAESRRHFCQKFESLLRSRGLSPETVWDEIERNSGGHLQAA